MSTNNTFQLSRTPVGLARKSSLNKGAINDKARFRLHVGGYMLAANFTTYCKQCVDTRRDRANGSNPRFTMTS